MLEEAYAYGLTPKEATELTVAEMASFIASNRKHELQQQKVLAQVGYSAGIVASMSLSKKRPRFEELFTFPQLDSKQDWQVSKAQLIAWAETCNRLSKRGKNG